MHVSLSEQVNADPQRVWSVVTDFDHLTDNITGIVSSEILDRPSDGLIGIKWRETRVMFGKEASETMWITDAADGQWYETMAQSHGMEYRSRISVEPAAHGSTVTFTLTGKAQTMAARLMGLLGFLFMGSMRKALAADLADIRRIAEQSS